MPGKRSRVAVVAVAGTLTLAAAVSAAVAIPPAGVPAGPASAAGAYLMTTGARQDAAAAQGSARPAAPWLLSRFRQVQVASAELDHEKQIAAAGLAAARTVAAGAARAAARRAAAERAAARAAAARRAAAEQAAAEQAAQRQAAQSAPASPAPSAVQQAAPAPSGTAQQIAEQMLAQFGWSSSQFSCLDALWARESGWNVYAQNPGSGAYGIPQALPGSKMASAGPDWQSDPATQIRWGLGYIQGMYGSPCGAWAHEQAAGWY